MNPTPEAVAAALKLADTEPRRLIDRDAYRSAWRSMLGHIKPHEDTRDACIRILAAAYRELKEKHNEQ